MVILGHFGGPGGGVQRGLFRASRVGGLPFFDPISSIPSWGGYHFLTIDNLSYINTYFLFYLLLLYIYFYIIYYFLLILSIFLDFWGPLLEPVPDASRGTPGEGSFFDHFLTIFYIMLLYCLSYVLFILFVINSIYMIFNFTII